MLTDCPFPDLVHVADIGGDAGERNDCCHCTRVRQVS